MSAAGDRDDTKAPAPAANRRKRASDITGLLRLPISLFQSFRSPARTSSAKTPSNAEPAVAAANSKIDILLPEDDAVDTLQLASWNELVHLLLHTNDPNLREVFLLTYPAFGKPDTLLQDVCVHLATSPVLFRQQLQGIFASTDVSAHIGDDLGSLSPRGTSASAAAATTGSAISPRAMSAKLSERTEQLYMARIGWLAQFVQQWLWNYPQDFTEPLTGSLTALLASLPKQEWSANLSDDRGAMGRLRHLYADLAVSLTAARARSMSEAGKVRGISRRSSLPSASFLKKFELAAKPATDLVSLQPVVVAKQLTLLHYELIKSILPRELTHAHQLVLLPPALSSPYAHPDGQQQQQHTPTGPATSTGIGQLPASSSVNTTPLASSPSQPQLHWFLSGTAPLDEEEKWRLAPNVLRVIAQHNKVTAWVTHQIVSEENSEARLRLLRFYIDVAMECLSLGNFDCVFALSAALRCEAVSSIKGVWKQLGAGHEGKLRTLTELINPSRNYFNYRRAYAAYTMGTVRELLGPDGGASASLDSGASSEEKRRQLHRSYSDHPHRKTPARGSTSSSSQTSISRGSSVLNLPRVPFLGVLLGDLVMAWFSASSYYRSYRRHSQPAPPTPGASKSTGTAIPIPIPASSVQVDPASTQDSLIYVPAFATIHRLVDDIKAAQRSHYTFDEVHDVQNLLREGIMIAQPHESDQLYTFIRDAALLSTPRVEVGSWDELVNYLIHQSHQDTEYRDAFLLTFLSFGTTTALLAAVKGVLMAPLQPWTGGAGSAGSNTPGGLISDSDGIEAVDRNSEDALSALLSPRSRATAAAQSASFALLCTHIRESLFKRVWCLQLLQTWLWDYPRDFTSEMAAGLKATVASLDVTGLQRRVFAQLAEHAPPGLTGLLSSVEAVAAARVYDGPLSPSSSSSSMTSSSSSVAHIHATFEQLKQVCADLSSSIAAAIHRKDMESSKDDLTRRQSMNASIIVKKLTEQGPTEELLSMDTKMIAAQMTLVCMELFVAINPRELTNTAWMKAKTKWQNAPSTLNFINHHNNTSWWVVQEIVRRTDSSKRVAVIRLFIDVADECLQLHNYDSAFAIGGGLSATPVYRLKYTWQDIGSKHEKKWKRLQAITDTAGNHAAFRHAFGIPTEKNEPRIPFLGVLLSDLVRIDTVMAGKRTAGADPNHTYPGSLSPRRSIAPTRSAMSAATAVAMSPAAPAAAASPRDIALTLAVEGPAVGAGGSHGQPVGPDPAVTVNFNKHLAEYRTISEVTRSQKSSFPMLADYAVQVVLRDCIMKSFIQDERQLYELSLMCEPKDKAEKDFEELQDLLDTAGFGF